MTGALRSEVLARPVVHRNPFRYAALPLLSRLQLAAFQPRRRVAKRFIGKPATKLYRIARACGLAGQGTVILDVGGSQHEIRFNARNTQFVPARDAVYEPELGALFDVLLDDDATFFDIGANWGYFSIYVLSRPGFKGTVHAFEPYPATFVDLRATARQSPFGTRFTCHELALSDRDGTVQFGQVEKLHQGFARIGGGEKSVEVQVRRLDGLDLRPPTLMKIDVEGHEAAVLRGARETIAVARPLIAFESWREWRQPEITLEPFAILAAASYRFFVPSWVARVSGVSVARVATNARPTPEDWLGLIELVPEQRFMLADQLNILAVPDERSEWLTQRFTA